MDIKQLNEELTKYLKVNEAKLDRSNDINFENIGCGFEVRPYREDKEFYSVYLSGYSNNTSKNLDFVSNSLEIGWNKSTEEKQELHDIAINEITKMIPELKAAADEFDNKIIEILKAHGFEKKVID